MTWWYNTLYFPTQSVTMQRVTCYTMGHLLYMYPNGITHSIQGKLFYMMFETITFHSILNYINQLKGQKSSFHKIPWIKNIFNRTTGRIHKLMRHIEERVELDLRVWRYLLPPSLETPGHEIMGSQPVWQPVKTTNHFICETGNKTK